MIGPVVIIPGTSGNMTGTSVLTSIVLDLRVYHSFCIQAAWTGSPVGTFSVQGSVDYKPYPDGQIDIPGTWNDIGATMTAPAGTSGSALLDAALTGIPFIRLQYTNSSGTGMLTVEGFSK